MSSRFDHVIYATIVYFLTDLGPKYAPKSLTFSEAFTLANLATLYASFALNRLLRPIATSVGSPYLDVAIFLPCVLLISFFPTYLGILGLLKPIPIGVATQSTKKSLAFLTALALSIALMLSYLLQEKAQRRVLKV